MIETGRAGLLARLALVNARVAANDPAGAVEAARDTVSLYPGTALAALALGKALLASNFLPAAIGEFQRALRIDRGLTEPQFLLGVAWLEAGEAERRWKPSPNWNPMRIPHLAARIAEAELLRAQPRANARYVRHLFDQFSADYDARMLGPACAMPAMPILRAIGRSRYAGRARASPSSISAAAPACRGRPSRIWPRGSTVSILAPR